MSSLDKEYQNTSIHVEEIVIKGGARRTLSSSPHQNDDDPAIAPSSAADTSTPSLGEDIQSGKIVVTLANLITKEEIEYVVQSSLAAAAASEDSVDTDQGLQGRFYVRMPTIPAAKLADCMDDALPEPISLFLEQILERTLTFIDHQLCPSLKETLFGNAYDEDSNANGRCASDVVSIAEIFRNNQLEFSDREPAINVYKAPTGHFGMHKDNKALTVLIPLSDPNNDFEGGGTAFWSQTFPKEGMHDPSLVLAPQPGTALLFGGKVSHKGLHIQSGTRVVFVASFSRCSREQEEIQ